MKIHELLARLQKFNRMMNVVIGSDFEIKDISHVELETRELGGRIVKMVALRPVDFEPVGDYKP
jgi:hypothetical protein